MNVPFICIRCRSRLTTPILVRRTVARRDLSSAPKDADLLQGIVAPSIRGLNKQRTRLPNRNGKSNDSEDLETLFESSIVSTNSRPQKENAQNDSSQETKEVNSNGGALRESSPIWKYIKRKRSNDPEFISRLMNENKRPALEGLWRKQLRNLDRMATLEKEDINAFVFYLEAFVNVEAPLRAVEVWKKMTELKIVPTLDHWNPMLRGAIYTRDIASLKSLFNRMIKSGVRPSNKTWTLYIPALIESGDHTAAIQAMEEMGKAWKAESVNPTPGQAKLRGKYKHMHEYVNSKDNRWSPSIIPINAILLSFLSYRVKRPDAARQVLEWALQEGVRPETSTYNTLLRPAVRQDNYEEIKRVLADMKAHDCEPDIITFTIFLDGLYRTEQSSFVHASPEKQAQEVNDIFKDMAEAGFPPTIQTYSTLLDALLSRGQANIKAAQAVLARMSEQGLKPTIHIYTILASHYFDQTPPNLAPIEKLWRLMQSDKVHIDHIFLDRMVEGYAEAGETEKMLYFLRVAPELNVKHNWYTLRQALVALVRTNEWDHVRELVDDVSSGNRSSRGGARSRTGEEGFWALVDMLRAQGMDLPERRYIAVESFDHE